MKNTILLGAVALFLLTTGLHALPPRPGDAQQQAVALTHATLHTVSDGVIENGTLTFANGKITGVYSDTPPDLNQYQQINLEGKHVYPGMILPASTIGLAEVDALRATIDRTETGSLNPSIRTITSYNTDSELIPTLRFNGVLTAQVAPESGLISGRSSIVNLDGWNWEDAAITVDDGIFVNWPYRDAYRYDAESGRVRLTLNLQYDEDRQSLEQLFRDAKAYAGNSNLKLSAIAPLFDGSSRLYIRANRPQAIMESIRFFRSLDIPHIVLLAGQGALDTSALLRKESIPVILPGVHSHPAEPHHDIDAAYRLPAELLARGVTVGMTYTRSNMRARNLAFNAGNSVAYGLSKEQALRMVTLSNAEILGIADRLGSITAGKDATFFVSDGDALDMRGQQISRVWIEGREVDLNGLQQQLYRRYQEKYAP